MSAGCARCAKLGPKVDTLVSELRELRGKRMTQLRAEVTTLEDLLSVAARIAEVALAEEPSAEAGT